jgi:hypothetical protein
VKELTLSTLIAVFEEMFGRWLFWALVLVALAVTIALVLVLARERGVMARRLIAAELIGIAGGFAAVWFVQFVTSSRLADLGGPVDVIVVIGIWAAGAAGALIAFYAAVGLASRRALLRKT